ncbi:VPLPA-CTERM sorting domain-containing protein [uncultured Roseobacter sp.]|uniref:VPLPA-CTERM sorting domain-containing protein n=2 Tax=uncultured Roseobacter sp. TaxID=114847 RepID=UPI00262BE1A4|nr:VPLPA-CTERM sorting domain-containing protein [uncultured Roseobacter sp.]
MSKISPYLGRWVKMTFFKTSALLVGLILSMPMAASAATLIGDTFNYQVGLASNPNLQSGSAVAGAGVDFSADFVSDRFIDVDVSEDTITFQWREAGLIGANFEDFEVAGWFISLTGLDFGNGIASVGVVEEAGTSRFPFGGNVVVAPTQSSILLGLNGVWDGNSSVTVSLTEVEISPEVVPLPASAPLLLAGFGGIMMLRRRRKAAA